MMSVRVFGDGTAQVKMMCGAETKFSDTVTEESAPMYINRFARAALAIGNSPIAGDENNRKEGLLRRLDLV